jgi:hypothetical protein
VNASTLVSEKFQMSITVLQKLMCRNTAHYHNMKLEMLVLSINIMEEGASRTFLQWRLNVVRLCHKIRLQMTVILRKIQILINNTLYFSYNLSNIFPNEFGVPMT